ncbi:hypothetical protein DFJ43DRAFT_1092061 [Lentinula guzmanii]|uniref:Uncharacterized protein n=2 Tax=Lentinula TaxID=5352 RepID=A0AA38MWZ8_9AGAR|nr:hypothetical protein DFJ43DRAFT_1092061 [Lentinula guzmanii]KAJ3788556.1 hypothetical protein GGU10DRAFT_306807 [Lentinula aff. detonsa]KAJ3801409.1 hypothetical protein GGU11DRAFT_717859 [Lentinula aff. detonsa]
MSATYTPSDVIDMSKEKEWAAALGMLDWDSTSIVFTKRSLIEFLKYTGTTVDTNFGNIQKLPRWAKFGKISSEMSPSDSNMSVTASTSSTTSEEFKPSRRVRQAPGGGHTDIFGGDDEDDALSQAPPKETEGTEITTSPAMTQEQAQYEEDHSGINFPSQVKPSRRVRTVPGGNSSLSNFWDSNDQQEEFKPTRRVRQGPGGQDNISGLF